MIPTSKTLASRSPTSQRQGTITHHFVNLHNQQCFRAASKPVRPARWREGSIRLPLENSSAPPAAGLSAYPLVERRSTGSGRPGGLNTTSKAPAGTIGSHAWLGSCARHIASSVGASSTGRGPTLQLVYSTGAGQHRFEAVPIPSAIAEDPQSWSQFASYVRGSGANGLVLVRPIASPEQHCAFAAPRPQPPAGATPVPPRAAHAAADDGRQPVPKACGGACLGPAPGTSSGTSPAPGSDVLDGRVGECCDGTRGGAASAAAAPLALGWAGDSDAGAGASARDGAGGGCSASPTQYFGLVVQGSCSSDADGCWVLKTTRSDSGAGSLGGCSCVHFSLTRVCYGQPLYEQLRDAWLVPRAAAEAGPQPVPARA